VLAAVAVHNVAFGERFGTLFRTAAQKIQAFAQKAQSEGASAADSDLIAKLAKVNESVILSDEYQKAQAHFHQVSQYKKVVETRTAPPKPIAPPPPPVAPASISEQGGPRAASDAVLDTQRGMLAQIEAGKLKSVEDSIKNFVRSVGQRQTCLVPLRNVNLTLLAPEIESFRADFGTERSFRADYAEAHRGVLAILGRVLSEEKDFQSKQNSEYLWKPHADSLGFLMTAARSALDTAEKVIKVAEQRGLSEKVAAMKASVQRLEIEVQRSAQLLENTSARVISK
jgi:hypothetical protein